MSTILQLTTLHNDDGTHDKVYLIAVVQDSEGEYRFATAHGPRTGTRPLVVAQPILPSHSHARAQHNDLSWQKVNRNGYRSVDWTRPGFEKLQLVVKDLDPKFYAKFTGTGWTSDEQPEPVVQRPVAKPARPVAPKPTPEPPNKVAPLLGRSSLDEREVDL